jgi:hypothetical protein
LSMIFLLGFLSDYCNTVRIRRKIMAYDWN